MIIALTGSNSFLLKKRLDELTQKFIAEHGDLALERIDGSDVESVSILEAIQSMPFLSGRKMVVVRDLSANSAANEMIEQIISSISDTTDLVIYEPITDKRSSYYKSLKSKTQFEEHASIDAQSLAKWLTAEAKSIGASLSLADANYMVERLGENQAILASELEKLAIYSSGISRQSIELLTEKSPQSKIFDLLDAAFAGNTKRALDLYEEQRAQKVEPQAIMALLTWQLHLISIAKAAKGKSPNQIASETKTSPYPLNKAVNLAKRITDEKLKEMISEAAQIDYKSRTVYLDIDEALKSYIASL